MRSSVAEERVLEARVERARVALEVSRTSVTGGGAT